MVCLVVLFCICVLFVFFHKIFPLQGFFYISLFELKTVPEAYYLLNKNNLEIYKKISYDVKPDNSSMGTLKKKTKKFCQ